MAVHMSPQTSFLRGYSMDRNSMILRLHKNADKIGQGQYQNEIGAMQSAELQQLNSEKLVPLNSACVLYVFRRVDIFHAAIQLDLPSRSACFKKKYSVH